MQNGFEYIYHGTNVNATELEAFMLHFTQVNLNAEAEGKRKTPLCIWGRHGIGKTDLVASFAKANGFEFAYLAPAQFEEMGDLIGMPVVKDGKTVFQAPDWVPQSDGPGILLIDDVNRADDRILRGIMQLLQYHEMMSWKLPPKWQIICTANPDGGGYSVTPMDEAMLTRMMHVSMVFDVEAWAKWAEKQFIDPRGINFVLTYPEIVSGERTTARTLVQFFEAIKGIENLSENLPLIQMLGDACLDEVAVSAFIAFVNQNLDQLLSPQELLNAKSFQEDAAKKIETQVNRNTLRVDILATMCKRLVNHIEQHKEKLSAAQIENLKSFLKIDYLPNDLRYGLAKSLIGLGRSDLQQLMSDPKIGRIYMNKI